MIFKVSLYNIYDIFNADENDIQLLKKNVCSEVVTDVVYDSINLEGKKYLAYEYLPGQYDQRADSTMQCLMLLNNNRQFVFIQEHCWYLMVKFQKKI